MKLFKFLFQKHKINFFIAFVLLFAQSNATLALPSLMSEIVNVGITQTGIESTVPKQISTQMLDDVEVFLNEDELALVEENFSQPNADGVREFIGDADAREQLETSFASAEMLAYQFEQGFAIDDFVAATGGDEQQAHMMSQAMGDTIDMTSIHSLLDAGMIEQSVLVESRTQLTEKLGDDGAAIIESRAIEFVKSAYEEIGISLEDVQSEYLWSEGALMFGYAFLTAILAIAAAFNASYTAAQISRDLRSDLYKRVLEFSPAEINQLSTASLVTRGTNDIQQIQTATVMCLRMVLLAPCMGLGAMVRVLSYNNGLSWIMASALVVICVVIGVLMGITMPKFKNLQTMVDRNNLVAREIITGILPIRAFGRTDYEEQRFDEANRELTRTYMFTNRAMNLMMPILMFIMNMMTIAIVWYGGHKIDAGIMQVGDLMAYINYSMQVIMAFMVITMVAVMLPRAEVAACRVDEVLSTEPSIKDIEGALDMSASKDPKVSGELAFNDVSFTYPGADEPIIDGINFVAKPGTTTAIIGSTGAGKSSLVQLIPRLFDVTEGSITIDGVDIRTMKLHDLRSLIGYVPQKRMLFSGDVESNIKFGNINMSDEDMVQAAQIAQAQEFIESKAGGYHAAISQGGSNVSGGQNQRLQIARALAIKPRILVFDDSFSALDYKTDATLRAAIDEAQLDSTVIIVAQRIATIMNAQNILVLDDGRIVGAGTHEQLLKTCPEYLEIAKSQLSAAELGLDDEQGGECVCQ